MLSQSQIQFIQQEIQASHAAIKQVVGLLADGATVPFIARYRKEQSGNMDEVQILAVKTCFEKFQEADKRRVAIIDAIEQQGKMTPELLDMLNKSLHISELEDLYLPYKQKRKTRAMLAIEKGLEPLAKAVFEQAVRDPVALATQFLSENVLTTDDALQGARDIIAEWINENIEARNRIRMIFSKSAILSARVKKGQEKAGENFKDYFEYNQLLQDVPSHRLLAIRRGENEGFLSVAIEIEQETAINALGRQFIQGLPACKVQMEQAITDACKRLLAPSIENEFAARSKEKADATAIMIFAENLRQLLLAAPLGQKRVLAVDPGFRTGCKVVVINELGDLKQDTVVFPQMKKREAEIAIRELVHTFQIEAIAIGNGTASRETEAFIKSLKLALPLGVFMVSEQGASIYSASAIAREEFPEKDITVRGAVSIGRRLKDPLAELVKIDAKSIGVGQYQHDVNQKTLKNSLDAVVESCVNAVGVELNTASKHLLSYVSGLSPTLAQNIVAYRNTNGKFRSRHELHNVPRLGAKAFEQAAGFLRIHGAENILDNTAVHPERYELIHKMAKDNGLNTSQLLENESVRKSIDLKQYVNAGVGMPTLNDIMTELAKPGRDPREQLELFEFADVSQPEDLREGMILPGIVTNITAFGCFVDIGVHQDGLIHISHLANRYIKDPNEVVKVHQKVRVKVLEIDLDRKRIALSMKEV